MGSRCALIFGGQSPEHEVSISSASNIRLYMQEDTYLIKITRSGSWLLVNDVSESDLGTTLYIQPGIGIINSQDGSVLDIKMAYLIVHGTNCEDGILQAIFESLKIPYTGSGVLESAICMSKARSKEIASALVETVPGFSSDVCPELSAFEKLGYPVIVKPEASGSSIGITILYAPDKEKMQKAFETASEYSDKVLFEKLIYPCLELECGILGDRSLRVCGLTSQGDFLSYGQKYLQGGNYITCPAEIDFEDEIRNLSLRIFKLFNLSGFARIDYLYDSKNKILYFNEINTIPGLCKTSHYPRMLLSSGISIQQFVNTIGQRK